MTFEAAADHHTVTHQRKRIQPANNSKASMINNLDTCYPCALLCFSCNTTSSPAFPEDEQSILFQRSRPHWLVSEPRPFYTMVDFSSVCPSLSTAANGQTLVKSHPRFSSCSGAGISRKILTYSWNMQPEPHGIQCESDMGSYQEQVPGHPGAVSHRDKIYSVKGPKGYTHCCTLNFTVYCYSLSMHCLTHKQESLWWCFKRRPKGDNIFNC